ncbi:MAG: hypothetical protein JWO37_1396 [Acidimicrobiales bacterium]|jgi:signal peptidase I|nr:hypothetical protein [Acidimicrobiales bacterium]
MHRSLRRLAAGGLIALIAMVTVAIGSGRVAYEVTNGVSMRPTYRTGDLVVVARASAYRHGQIVAYRAGQHVVLHRIIGGDATGFVMKGDSNQSIDPTRPTAKQLIGRAVLHLPKFGAALRSPISRGLLVVVVLALFGVLMRSPNAKPAGVHPSARRTRRAPTLWKSLAALDVLVLVALGMTFVLAPHPVSPVGGPTQTGALSYHAAVPISDTYPTGTISTGDPVFVKLVQALGVSFHYATDTPPGSVRGTARLDAAVSTVSGWHTTLPMVAPTALVGGAADMNGTLELARIQALATSVEKATGLGFGTLDVDVTASVDVSFNGAKPLLYSSHLPLQLSTLELTLSGVKPSPSPHGPAVTSTVALDPPSSLARHQPGTVPQQIRLGLLAALILCVGTTVVMWPPSAVSDDDRAGGGAQRVRAVGLQRSNTTRVQLADRAALERLAARVGCPIVDVDDGLSAVVTADSLYWVAPQALPAESGAPVPATAA